MIHPDDQRELDDEVSGFTRWDDNNERYGGQIDWEAEAHYDWQEWNSVSVWAKVKRWFRWQWERFLTWREKDEIPF